MYRFLLAILLTLLLLTSASSTHAHRFVDETTFVIHMTDTGFEPAEITIRAGDTIIFENSDTDDHWPASDVHPTHEIYSDFDSKHPVLPGEEWAFRFTEEGSWTMHDHIFPHFEGVVHVVAPDTEEIPIPTTKAMDETIIEEVETTDTGSFFDFFETFFAWLRPDTEESDETACHAGDFSCLGEELEKITSEQGPQEASDTLTRWMQESKVAPSVDEHQLSHLIGRQAAKTFGATAESFMNCPMADFNGGCQHGFFEYVLGRSDTEAGAAEEICESMGDTFSDKDKFYCYHGVGHGVMMAALYEIETGLEVCDEITQYYGQEGCWQGLFMENTAAAMGDFAREGVFSHEDPLAPCNTLERKYQDQCFINHAGWLMVVFQNDVGAASAACLDAPETSIDTCMQSLGLMVTNPAWMPGLAPRSQHLTHGEIAWELCEQFPEEYTYQCILGGLDNIINFDQHETARAEAFCSIVDAQYRDGCFRRIGANIANQSLTRDKILETCATLTQMNDLCLEGAGI